MTLSLLAAFLVLALWGGASLIAVLLVLSRGKARERQAKNREAEQRARASAMEQELNALSRYRHIVDAELEAARIRAIVQSELEQARHHASATTAAADQQAQVTVTNATQSASQIVSNAHQEAQRIAGDALSLRHEAEHEAARIRAIVQSELEQARHHASATTAAADQQAQVTVTNATQSASQIVSNAHQEAQRIAGDALSAQHNLENYRREAKALENVIAGYGDQYIVPAVSVLDDVAESLGFTEAGARLKEAREKTRGLIKGGQAATCEYVEANRRDTAIAFVTDAFNGKVDSILSRVKEDNVGTLGQKVQDAFALVNMNGRAFRNARILDGFLKARLEELRWAAAAQELKNREKEEQRRIKDQMREEEKARREYERAIRDAEKEEEAIKKAIERVQNEVAKANDEQRQRYEAQLAELAQKLQAAEEKNRRALSMAQQTKTGHVYIISNIGSFGEEVFKIGLTRRLEPLDRIHELGDASVPFPFDVHAMILSENAPALEHALHRHFLTAQMNKTNPRKEFFRVSLKTIREEIEKLGVQASWTMTAAAAEYRQSLAIDKAIKENPASYQTWINKQLVLENQAEAMDQADLAEAS